MNLQGAMQGRTDAIDTARRKNCHPLWDTLISHTVVGLQGVQRGNKKCKQRSKLVITEDRFLSLLKIQIPLCGDNLPKGFG